MSQPVTIRVENARAVYAAFRKVDQKLATELGADLKKAVAPVVDAAKQKEQRWAGASINTIRSKRSGLRVFVEQSARKKTGLRPDFGALQMSSALEPALEENVEGIRGDVEDTLDRYARAAGF